MIWRQTIPIVARISQSSSFYDKECEEKFQLFVEYKNNHHSTKVQHIIPILGSWVGTIMNEMPTRKIGYQNSFSNV